MGTVCWVWVLLRTPKRLHWATQTKFLLGIAVPNLLVQLILWGLVLGSPDSAPIPAVGQGLVVAFIATQTLMLCYRREGAGGALFEAHAALGSGFYLLNVTRALYVWMALGEDMRAVAAGECALTAAHRSGLPPGLGSGSGAGCRFRFGLVSVWVGPCWIRGAALPFCMPPSSFGLHFRCWSRCTPGPVAPVGPLWCLWHHVFIICLGWTLSSRCRACPQCQSRHTIR